MKRQFYDLTIIGAGLVGTTLAGALRDSGLNIAMVEARAMTTLTQQGLDTRTLALALGSQQTLQEYGLWEDLAQTATPIEHIHISDRGHFGATRLHAHKYHVPAFGYVVEMPSLQTALQHQREQADNVTLYCPAEVTAMDYQEGMGTLTVRQEQETLQLSAPLIVAADGANSSLRRLLKLDAEQREYQQMAVVTNVQLARPHTHTAYERFTAEGPVAMLPVGERNAAMIWTSTPTLAEQRIDMSDDDFLAALQQAFGYRCGRFVAVGKRLAYPLKMTLAETITQPGVVFIGNAAQSLHPIAGQGFNLGLRDVSALVHLLLQADVDIRSSEFLSHYQAFRQRDRQQMIDFTEILTRMFTNPLRSVSVMRDMGLLAFDRLPWLQQALVHRTMGLTAKQQFVREIHD